MTKLYWPAPERNKDPILQVLARTLPASGTVLEIGSGSGQHVVHFAAALPHSTFQPTDLDTTHLESIKAWIAETGVTNVRAPRLLDVCATDWGVGLVDAIFSANMLHIAPWKCTPALMAGAGRHLPPCGLLLLYGPFHVDGRPTAPSNAAFDADLRGRDPSWGVRDLGEVTRAAEGHGLALEERLSMPANNQLLVFRKQLGT